MRFRVTHLFAFCAFGLALLASPISARAGDTEIKTIITQVGAWDSNPMMRTRDVKPIYGSVTTPELSISSKTQTSQIRARAWINQNFFNRSEYNSTDLHATTDLSRNNERWEARLQGGVDYDTTRTSELTNYGLDVGSVRHFAYNIGPSISFSPTVLDNLALSASFQKAVYDSSTYSNYSIVTVTPTYTRRLTQLTSALLSAEAQRYQSERDPKRRIDSLSPTLGFQTSLTPSVTLSANAGAQTSKETGSQILDEEWKWHYLFSSTLDFKDEQNSVSFSATRTRQPFGNGTDSLLTTVGLDNRHDLNTRVTLTFGGSYQFANYDNDIGQNLDDLITGRTGLAYHITQTLDLTASYEYRHETLTNDGGTAERNLARLGLRFNPDWDDILR